MGHLLNVTCVQPFRRDTLPGTQRGASHDVEVASVRREVLALPLNFEHRRENDCVLEIERNVIVAFDLRFHRDLVAGDVRLNFGFHSVD